MVSVVNAVERDIELLAARAPGIDETTEAATARVLARDLDDTSTSATQRAGASKALGEAMARLRDLAPADLAGDAVDQVAAKRADRRRRAAG